MNKAELRKLIKVKLQNAGNFDTQDESLSSNLKSLLSEIANGRKLHLGGYKPIQAEPKWFRKFDKGDMNYSLVHMHDELRLSYHPIEFSELLDEQLGLQLSADKLSQIVTPDVIIIPGLAFTRNLERLGRGKAYFDTFLKDYKGIRIGVFYSIQEVDDVLSEEHDEALNYIVTDTEIIRGNKNDN